MPIRMITAACFLVVPLLAQTRRGLFFRGSEPLPFGSEIRPVRDLIRYLLTGQGLRGEDGGHDLEWRAAA